MIGERESTKKEKRREGWGGGGEREKNPRLVKGIF